MAPVKIEIKDKKFLFVKWDDDSVSIVKLSNLRRNCPCALCKSEREEQSKSYIPIYGDIELAIADIQIVGQYAIKIVWKDSHETGLYEFGFIKQLSE